MYLENNLMHWQQFPIHLIVLNIRYNQLAYLITVCNNNSNLQI